MKLTEEQIEMIEEINEKLEELVDDIGVVLNDDTSKIWNAHALIRAIIWNLNE